MTILRALVLSLLCLGVLPWGALARHVEAPGPVAASPAAEPVQRSCSGATLPGSACAPDAVLALPKVAETRRGTTAPPKAVRLRDLHHPKMPLDPPKGEG